MKFNGILVAVFWNIIHVENRMIPPQQPTPAVDLEVTEPPADQNDGSPQEKVLGLKSEDSEEYGYEKTKPCAIVVLSNYQNPNMQSLMRKYRYDSNGLPEMSSSSKYFPQSSYLRISECAKFRAARTMADPFYLLDLRKLEDGDVIRNQYNAGLLIPSSVQYFIKLPQGLRSSPLLVPLNNKAFSPLGGFVRYYKEVPPIPQSWFR